MERRITRGSNARQKRQVRMLQRQFEAEGMSKTEARTRAEMKGRHLFSAGAGSGGRLVSKRAEAAEIARRPKRKQGIRVRDGIVVLPRRITSKRAEIATSGGALKKRSAKARR